MQPRNIKYVSRGSDKSLDRGLPPTSLPHPRVAGWLSRRCSGELTGSAVDDAEGSLGQSGILAAEDSSALTTSPPRPSPASLPPTPLAPLSLRRGVRGSQIYLESKRRIASSAEPKLRSHERFSGRERRSENTSERPATATSELAPDSAMTRDMTSEAAQPPFLRRGSKGRSLRQRHSMQDAAGAPSMRSVRRLERHSIGGSSFNSLEVSLLEYLHVQFVKALVPASKLSRPRYVMKVTNVALNRSWEMMRPYREFYEMKEKLVAALNHGHLCKSNCPWIYMYATHHFPRRHLFRSRQASVVSGRLTELETFINTLLRVMKEQRSLECSISAQALPKILYDFLYEGMVFDRSDFANTILESRVSLGGAPSDLRKSTLAPEDACTICQRALKSSDSYLSLRSSDPTSSSSSSSSEGDIVSVMTEHQSLTTLECGHRFHDDCILEKLNESLKCPLCVDPAAA